MLIEQKDLYGGNILPVYRDHQECRDFIGMAVLIEKQDSFYKNGSKSHFVKMEKDNRISNDNYVTGQKIYYRNKKRIWETWTIAGTGQDNLYIKKGDATNIVSLGSIRIADLLSYGDNILISSDNYTKTYVIVEDYPTHSIITTYKDFYEQSSEIGERKLIKIEKPFKYKKELQEPFTYIWKSERWLVKMSETAFWGELVGGEDVYFKDLGKFVVHGKNKGKVIISNSYLEITDAKPSDIFPFKRLREPSHAWFSYQLTTGSRWAEGIEDSECNDTEDFWEEN